MKLSELYLVSLFLLLLVILPLAQPLTQAQRDSLKMARKVPKILEKIKAGTFSYSSDETLFYNYRHLITPVVSQELVKRVELIKANNFTSDEEKEKIFYYVNDVISGKSSMTSYVFDSSAVDAMIWLFKNDPR